MFSTATLNTLYVILVTFLNCTVNRKHVSLQINVASLTYFMKAKGYNCFYADVPLEYRQPCEYYTDPPGIGFHFLVRMKSQYYSPCFGGREHIGELCIREHLLVSLKCHLK